MRKIVQIASNYGIPESTGGLYGLDSEGVLWALDCPIHPTPEMRAAALSHRWVLCALPIVGRAEDVLPSRITFDEAVGYQQEGGV